MTQEEYVSFDVAKLLHEKGFEIDTDKDYWKIGEDGTRYFMSSIGAYTSDINNKYAFYRPANSYPCPTQQMAMRWLREEMGLVIIIDYSRLLYAPIPYYFHIYTTSGNNGGREDNLAPIDPYYNYKYKAYEEACEAAIKYCLENLI